MKKTRHSPFTLIEMLVVLGIVAILLAVAAPAFNKLTVGSGVNAGVRGITAQLQMARQYAIANRKYVAVIMPSASGFGDNTEYRSFGSVQSTTGAGPYTWVPNTTLELMPIGALLAEADGDADSADPPSDDAATLVTVDVDTNNNGVADVLGVRAIIFRPSGALYNANAMMYVTVAEGFFDGTSAQLRNAQNQIDITINQFTGRIKVVE